MAHKVLRRTIATEYQECAAYWQWCQAIPILRKYVIKHVNEGKRDPVTGYRLKQIGMRPGLLDYQFPVPNKKYHGLWIEEKKRDQINKKKDPNQIEWIDNLNEIKHYATFAYGWEEAMEITMAYLEDKI